MILRRACQHRNAEAEGDGLPAGSSGDGMRQTANAYHRFVKTTPKPRATKKRRGELEPPWLLVLSLLWLVPDGLDD